MFITDQIYPFGYKATTVEKFTTLTVFAEAKNIKLKMMIADVWNHKTFK